MSIQNELDRISNNVENTYAVLEALGCDIPESKNSDNLSTTAGTSKVVLYKEQTLTEEQKEQVRKNIGISNCDMLIKSTSWNMADKADVSVVKGNALDVFNKCKNGENPKVVLWLSYESEDYEDEFLISTAVKASHYSTSYKWLSVTFTDMYGTYKRAYTVGFDASSARPNTVETAYFETINLDRKIDYPLDSNGYVDRGKAGQIATSDGSGGITWSDGVGGATDWDMLIKTTDFTSDVANYTVVKGNATDIFTRCKAGEQLKVGLLVESDYEDPSSKIMSAESVDATGELGDYGYAWLNIIFGYNDGENENMWTVQFDTNGVANNTIYRAEHTYNYYNDVVKHPTNEWGSAQFGEVGQFAVSDGNGGITWLTVNNGNEVAY